MAVPGSALRDAPPRGAQEAVHDRLASRVVAGVAGAVAMLAVLEAAALSEGMALARPLEVIGWTFVGPEGMGSVAASVAFGALVHVTVAIVLALILTAIVSPEHDRTSAVGVGVGFAFFALGIMMSLVVPWANPEFRGEMQEIGGGWVIAHAVFGAVLGLRPGLRRSRARATEGVAAARDAGRPRPAPLPAAPAPGQGARP